MQQFYSNESVFQVLFITLVLGGGCALLAGRAIALTWRSIWIAAVAMIPMGLAVRFVHFALFNETLWAAANLSARNCHPDGHFVPRISANPRLANGEAVLLAV